MKRSEPITLLAVCSLILALLLLFQIDPGQANSAGSLIARVSVSSAGSEGNGDSEFAALSADARYVAFDSRATNLVSTDANGVKDVFLHDRQTGATTLISVASNGDQGNGDSGGGHASLSADGRYIAFTSLASNLVTGDTNGQRDVFVHDQQSGATVRVSIASDGGEGSWFAEQPDISADGRYVTFVTRSALVPNDTNNSADIYVHDRDADNDAIFDEPGAIATVRVSVASDGSQANHASGYTNIAISADGRHVSFDSQASNLVTGDTNQFRDAFAHDRDSDNDGIFDEPGAISTVRISVAADGSEGDGPSYDSDISGNGRFVTFWSEATTLIPDDTTMCGAFNCIDVFVRDRDTDVDGILDEPGATSIWRISVASDGTPGNGHAYYPAMASDGSAVAFYTSADNLVPGDNSIIDVFVHELATGITSKASITHDAMLANQSAWFPAISGNGQFVAFHSLATNLVPGDTNFRADVFVHNRLAGGPTPTPTQTLPPSATPTLTPSPTATPSPTSSPTMTATPVASPAPDGWQRQTLDVAGHVGAYVSLQLDSAGFPHLSYEAEQGLTDTLKYIRWDGVVWQSELITQGGDAGSHSDLALMTNDTPAVTYRDRSSGSLHFALRQSGGWVQEVAHEGPGVGFHSSLALNPFTNIAHILHADFLQGQLLHTRQLAGEWETTVVASGVGTVHNDLAFDSAGSLHAAYYDGPTTALHYASWDGANWNHVVVDSAGDVGMFNSLTFNSLDQPQISYYDADADSLKYATFDGTNWQIQAVNMAAQGGQYSSIAVDSSDTVFISYYDVDTLLLAEWQGTAFASTELDNGASVGLYSSLDMDGQDRAHIGYHDGYFSDLRYLTWGDNWEFRAPAVGAELQRPCPGAEQQHTRHQLF